MQGVGKVADRPAAGRRKRIPGVARSFFHHLARARSSAPQQGLVSLQGAERRRLRLLLFLLLAEGRCGRGRDCYGTRIRDGDWRGVMADEKAPSFCSARLFPIRPSGGRLKCQLLFQEGMVKSCVHHIVNCADYGIWIL